MAAPTRSGPSTLLLALAALLCAAAIIVLGVAPLAPCPECFWPGPKPPPAVVVVSPPGSRGVVTSPTPAPAGPRCSRCNDRGKVSYLNRWFVRDFEGKPVGMIVSRGFRRTSSRDVWDRTAIRLGTPLTRDLLEDAQLTALRTGAYESVKVDAFGHAYAPGSVKVIMTVVERVR